MDSIDAPTEERRSRPNAPLHGGKRWRDDPDLTDAVTRALLPISRDFNYARDAREWSQDETAYAAGIAPNTLLAIEQARHDPHLSTLVRLAHIFGFEVVITLRRAKRIPQLPAVNLSAPTTSP